MRTQASPAERDGSWPRLVEKSSRYADYQRATDGMTPVAVLEPR